MERLEPTLHAVDKGVEGTVQSKGARKDLGGREE